MYINIYFLKAKGIKYNYTEQNLLWKNLSSKLKTIIINNNFQSINAVEIALSFNMQIYWVKTLFPFENTSYHKLLKGHWTTSASSPHFFSQKSWDFYISSVYLCSDCMLNLTCNFNLITKIGLCEFFLQQPFFKICLLLHYSSLEEKSEACLCSSLNRYNI